jgi:glycosyltransferase involved in cell wall biosynthesis
MKILVVSQYFWPEEFRINDLAQGLQERGHEVTVLTGCPNYPNGRSFPGYSPTRIRFQNYGGVAIKRVPLITRGNAKGFRLALNYLSYCLTASILGPFLCRGAYDVVFIYQTSPVTVGIPAILLKWLKKAPALLWVQDLWPESLSATGAIKSPWIIAAVRKLVRAIYHHCDLILVQSPAFSPKIAAEGVSVDKIHYYPNSVESYFRPPNEVGPCGVVENLPSGFLVMFAGNIGVAQSFDTILSAAQLTEGNPDIHWIILGDGRMKEWVEAEVSARGLSGCVHLLGRRPTEQMPHYFAVADAMLVTLKKEPIFSLTVPSKIQSYMACGRPIVAALDGEGQRLITASGAGLVCTAGDAEGLASIVLEMYQMPPDDRERMGQNGREYCESHFDREVLLAQLEGWMTELSAPVGA